MSASNTGNTQAEFLQSLLHAIRSAGQHGPDTPPETNAIKNLVEDIQKAIGQYDRLIITVQDESMTCGGEAVSSNEEVTSLRDLLEKRRIASINFPKRPPTGELWSLLTILGGVPELLIAKGGPGYNLMAAGIRAIRIEEAEEKPGAWGLSTQDFEKNPDIDL